MLLTVHTEHFRMIPMSMPRQRLSRAMKKSALDLTILMMIMLTWLSTMMTGLPCGQNPHTEMSLPTTSRTSFEMAMGRKAKHTRYIPMSDRVDPLSFYTAWCSGSILFKCFAYVACGHELCLV